MFGFSRKKKRPKAYISEEDQQQMIGENLSFAASEAYKLLRTNLTFSFADEDTRRVIGVTSSLKGEGKVSQLRILLIRLQKQVKRFC